MPLQPGEVSLLTLFADVHYYFSAPSAKPVHDRFDKRSYVYLYHDAINKRGRLEVANHAGSPDQDAFQGLLDRSHIEYSQKQPNLFTIIVDSQRQHNDTAAAQADTSQWHLPAADLRNEGKYMYRLHTIDLYFWTVEDATMFSDSLRRCLQPHQIRSLDGAAAHSEHRESMSPVVQQLERAAITPGQVGRNDSVSTAQSSTAPRSAHTPVSPITTSPAPVNQGRGEAPAGFAPMAYNPAAPAAPEPIAHREKTPPPADAASGTGLTQAATHDYGTAGFAPQPGLLQHQGSYQAQQAPSYFPGPPQQSIPGPPQVQRTNTSGSFPPPPPQQQSPYQASVGTPGSQQQTPQFAQSFSPPPQQQHQDPNQHLYGQQPQPGLQRQTTSPHQFQQQYVQAHPQQQQVSSPPPHQQSFSPQPPTQYAQYHPGVLQQAQASPGFQASPPPTQPTYQIGQPSTPGYSHPMQSPGFPPAPPQQQQQQPSAPIGGYSGYNYQQGAGQQPSEAYNIHQQVYRPTEAEAAHSHGGQKLHAGQPASAPAPAAPGKMEQRLDKYEKGVSKFFKRLDKKI